MRILFSMALAIAVAGWIGAASAVPKVVATISPVHSLVAGVMRGVASPTLLLRPGASPHGYAMRPSDARALAEADIVFWIGENLEQFLSKPLETLAAKATQVELANAPGLTALKFRTGEAWDAHDEPEAHQTRDEAHSGADPHVWLDPANARTMVEAIAGALSHADPDNAHVYEINAESLRERLSALDRDIAAKLVPVAGRPFLVFHDSYQYLERRYRLTALGAVTISPERQPGVKRVSELRKRLAGAPGACLFSEPQFSPALIGTLAGESDLRLATLDPLGAEVTPGPDAYFATMTRLANALHDCLAALP